MAGNLESDGAIVQPMSTALESRLLHLELVVDSQEWCDWAVANDFDHRITDQIKFKPGNIYTFQPDHTDHTYACPRTWEFANRLVKEEGTDSPDILPLLAGTISEGVAREFLTFCKIYDNLPKHEKIAVDPMGVKVPTEPSILYAMTGNLSHNITAANAASFMTYLGRIPKEFQVICMREVVRKHKPLRTHSAIVNWVATSAIELF
jgi:hypothetical protein